jgi:hypothetical protein
MKMQHFLRIALFQRQSCKTADPKKPDPIDSLDPLG